MEAKSQNKLVLDYLKQGHHLTSLEAIYKWRCTRLSAGIWDLRAKGYPIGATIKTNENGKKYAEYWLVQI